MLFSHIRSRAESNIGDKQQSHGEQGQKPQAALSAQISPFFCLILLFRSPRVALWKDERHLVAYDLFDISVIVSFALFL